MCRIIFWENITEKDTHTRKKQNTGMFYVWRPCRNKKKKNFTQI